MSNGGMSKDIAHVQVYRSCNAVTFEQRGTARRSAADRATTLHQGGRNCRGRSSLGSLRKIDLPDMVASLKIGWQRDHAGIRDQPVP